MTETAALDLARRGWRIAPAHECDGGLCTCRDGINCKSKGKHPRTAHGFKDASRDPEQIRTWWRRWPHANIAGATGVYDGHGVVVLDLDKPRRADDQPPPELAAAGVADGIDALGYIAQQAGQEWPATRTHESWSGALHLIFRIPVDVRIRSTTSTLGWKVDVKADGGMIMLPPSSINDRPYFQRTDDGIPQDVRPLPDWLIERLRDKPRPARPAGPPARLTGGRSYVEKAITAELDMIASCTSGRNDQLAKSAFSLGTLVGAGLVDGDLIHQDITDAAEKAGIDPSEPKAQNTIRRALDAGSRHPRTIPEKKAS
jgi:hypothetical protein